jgi:ribosome-binding protein aMBF1 (putative translation factor)
MAEPQMPKRKIGFAARENRALYDVKQKPGIILAGARGKEGLTRKQLAPKCSIPQSHISEMEQGKRPIGIKTAKILAAALNIGYKVFL